MVSTGNATMARKRGRPKAVDQKDTTLMRAPKDFAFMVKQLAGAEGVSVADYVDRKLRKAVSRDYAKLLQELAEEGGDE